MGMKFTGLVSADPILAQRLNDFGLALGGPWPTFGLIEVWGLANRSDGLGPGWHKSEGLGAVLALSIQ